MLIFLIVNVLCFQIHEDAFELYSIPTNQVVGAIEDKFFLMDKLDAVTSKSNTFIIQDGKKLVQDGKTVCDWGIIAKVMSLCKMIKSENEFVTIPTTAKDIVNIRAENTEECFGYDPKDTSASRKEIFLTTCDGPYETKFKLVYKNNRENEVLKSMLELDGNPDRIFANSILSRSDVLNENKNKILFAKVAVQ